jgi:class 3 adenylate cyclase
MAKDIELAIVFADVVGSTRLYEELGDQRAREVVASCIDIMRQATEEHHGTVIKTMGDEVMSLFGGERCAECRRQDAEVHHRQSRAHGRRASRGHPHRMP